MSRVSRSGAELQLITIRPGSTSSLAGRPEAVGGDLAPGRLTTAGDRPGLQQRRRQSK